MADIKRIDIYVGTVGQAYMDKETAKIGVERAKQNVEDWREIYELALAYIDNAEYTKQNAEEAKNRAEQIYAYLESLIGQNEGLIREQLNELRNEVNDNDYDSDYTNGGSKYAAQNNLNHILSIINDLTTISQKSNENLNDWINKVAEYEAAYEVAEEIFKSYLPEEDNNELDGSDALEQEFRDRLAELRKQLTNADSISKNINEFTDYTNEEINKILNGDYIKPVLSVSVSPAKVTLEKGQSVVLTTSIYPTDASNKKVTWAAANSMVELSEQTENSVKVTYVSEGETSVTVTSEDSGKSATATITCKAESGQEQEPNIPDTPVDPEGKYKFAVLCLSKEVNDKWDDLIISNQEVGDMMKECWENDFIYINGRPDTYLAPAPNDEKNAFILIMYSIELGEAKLEGMDGTTINSGKMYGRADFILPEGVSGTWLAYENATKSYLNGTSKLMKFINWENII